MEERKYEVFRFDVRIASNMNLQDALSLIECLITKYYMERGITYSIKEQSITSNEREV